MNKHLFRVRPQKFRIPIQKPTREEPQSSRHRARKRPKLPHISPPHPHSAYCQGQTSPPCGIINAQLNVSCRVCESLHVRVIGDKRTFLVSHLKPQDHLLPFALLPRQMLFSGCRAVVYHIYPPHHGEILPFPTYFHSQDPPNNLLSH